MTPDEHLRSDTKGAEIRRVANAIRKAWEDCGEVPFPLYDREVEELAKAAIAALREA